MVRLRALIPVPILLVAFFLAIPIASAWQSTLSPQAAGPFPEIRPFVAEYRLGWAEIEAARASASISYDGKNAILTSSGATTGFARTLYQLDASLDAAADRASLQTIHSTQLEKYTTRTLSTRIEGKNGTITSLREWISPSSKPSKWKLVKIAPIRDLFAAALFIRSQPLAKGDKVRTLVFPGGSPFLVDIESLGPEKILLADSPQDALRLDIKIQSVNTKKANALEPHHKFRSGTLWLSNDTDRILLRAEVQVFVGYVFAELASFHPTRSSFPDPGFCHEGRHRIEHLFARHAPHVGRHRCSVHQPHLIARRSPARHPAGIAIPGRAPRTLGIESRARQHRQLRGREDPRLSRHS